MVAPLARRRPSVRSVDDAAAASEIVGDRTADGVAQFGGWCTFIVGFILSKVAALQAPVILMSRNRKASRDRIAAGLDCEVNLKAEIEIMALHEKLDDIRTCHFSEILCAQSERLFTLIHHAERTELAQVSAPVSPPDASSEGPTQRP